MWYQVIALDALGSLLLSGVIAPPFGEPSTTLRRLTLLERGTQASTFEIRDSVFGQIEGCDDESGWRVVFGGLVEHLKQATAKNSHVERITPPIQPDPSPAHGSD